MFLSDEGIVGISRGRYVCPIGNNKFNRNFITSNVILIRKKVCFDLRTDIIAVSPAAN
jgi:hypothetical protein